ncbi:STAS domain-containing protein [Deferribacteraceae bacterium V6Fe1]|jgi:anti-sigma B factor antagonist|uniref:STAS domain-containing protein n=1 Tax=Deferrivibrio essentukiensis TaxID=2880922 RepID=UPI00199E310D|nr:STAS domain-containing protein [Deferrivibrio essentukiensis]MBC7197469.1 STAS domain-containing protein [Deferribacterales bacterium]MBZ4672676.1 anti-sigma-factor antagonist [Deferribacteraceae bacterium]MCB4204438.1 STAS domain-containing protein [Deferrivibrio essentukiensis]UOD34600.1 STAS domain-containing protein [Deferribacteraceae bacterium V6Fe1]
MSIYKERDGKIELIFPINDLDTLTGEEIARYLTEIVNEIDGVIINFSRVNYLNSSGLRELIQILKYLKDHNIKLALTRLSDNIAKIFNNTNLHKLFEIFDTDDEAKRSLLQ